MPRAHGRQRSALHLNYFLKNRHRFAYTTMVGLGLPRGSGAVESAIRRVINHPHSRVVVHAIELPESVDAILLLRSFYKSGRWNCLQRMAMTLGGCERVTGKSRNAPPADPLPGQQVVRVSRPAHPEVLATHVVLHPKRLC